MINNFRYSGIGDFMITADSSMTEPKLEMLEPVPRFVEYEESDWWWLTKYGYARIVQKPMSKFYQMGRRLIMHPALLDQIKMDPRFFIKTTS